MNNTKVPTRILGSLLSSVSAGVVPRSGAPYIAIGRTEEVAALSAELDKVADGESSMRFLIGRYGSGKSFLIQLMRGYAMDRGFVTADADLSPERRLSGSGGEGLATYRELIKNMSSKASPDGAALPVIIGRWFSEISSSLASGGLAPGSEEFDAAFTSKIFDTVRKLEYAVGGFDFACVISEYYKAYRAGDDSKMSACMRWLRGEFETKSEARSAIGIRALGIISDDNWYEHIKLFASLVRLIGYKGLVVFIDEGVNLYKITNRISRENNYEKLLAMFNDTLQGRAEGLMIVFGGTPQFLEDTRRGLFSYEALRSRLSDSRYADSGLKSFTGPVIRLRRLSESELLALVMRLTVLHAQYHKWEPRVTDDEKKIFVEEELARAGANEMITPREIIRDYISVLNLLLENPDADFASIVAPMKEAASAEVADVQNKSGITINDLEF
mgnify:CR=1 FL=1